MRTHAPQRTTTQRFRIARFATVASVIAILIVGDPAQCQDNDCFEWSSLQIGSMAFHSMAYDSHRGVTVLYGGRDKQTWEWDGEQWTFRGFGGPPWRNHLLAYDSKRHVTVGYGSEEGATTSETWEWDGDVWTLRLVGGLSPRWSAEMEFDHARGVTVLFGGNGEGGPYYSETWEWDGQTWTYRSSAGPSPRAGHAMTYHSGWGKVVVHGGSLAFTGFGDLWSWDGSTWIQMPGELYRTSHRIVYDEVYDRLITFSGYNGLTKQMTNQTWQHANGQWSIVNTFVAPPERYAHTMVFDALRSKTVMMGGALTVSPYSLNDTWEFNGVIWQRRSPDIPKRRQYHAMAFDSVRGVTVLFGGQITSSPYSIGDTWEWNGASWAFRGTSGPSRQIGHAMAFDSARGVTVLVGVDKNLSTVATWEWDGVEWSLRSHSGLPYWGPMVYDRSRSRVVTHRGSVFGTSHGETWEWDGESWTLRSNSGPPARYGHFLAYDVDRAMTVLYGGRDPDTDDYLGDTWEFDGLTGEWTLRDTNGPTYPYDSALMTHDSSRKVTVLFTGVHPNPSSSDTPLWLWNGIRWSSILAPGPESISHGAMVFDELRIVSVIFGGNNRDFLWELTLPRVGDTDCDGIVGAADLMTVVRNWGACADCPGDVEPYGGDGNVGVPDLLTVINNWGP